MQKQHHLFSPSKLGRIDLCPGSSIQEKKALDLGYILDEDPEAAAEGTLLHSLLPPDKSLGGLNEEQAWVVRQMRQHIAEKLWGADKIIYENTCTLWGPNKEPVTFGISDVVGIFQKQRRARIDEMKCGRNTLFRHSVEWQQRAYAGMTMQEHDLDSCEVFVYQPRESVEFYASYSNPAAIASQIEAIIWHAKEHPEELNPSLEACQFCRAKMICPTFKAEILEQLPVIRARLEIASLEELGNLISKAKAVKSLADEVESFAKQVLAEGQEIPGWTLQEREVRRIENTHAADRLIDGMLTPTEFYECTKVNVGKLEDSFARAWSLENGVTIKAGKEAFSEVLKSVIKTEKQKILKRKE